MVIPATGAQLTCGRTPGADVSPAPASRRCPGRNRYGSRRAPSSRPPPSAPSIPWRRRT